MQFDCEKGDGYKWFSNKHQSNHLFDTWSLIHINFGIILFVFVNILTDLFPINNKISKSAIIAFIVIILFEIIENDEYVVKLWKKAGYPAYAGDTCSNIYGDILCGTIGVIIAAMNKKYEGSYINLIILYTIIDIIAYNISKESSIHAIPFLFEFGKIFFY